MKQLLLGLCLFSSVSVFAQNRTMTLMHLQNAQSYFGINIQDSGLLKGSYPGWCADWDTRIEDGTYGIKFYSSYHESLPQDLIFRPEYLDEVNWLANQNFVGKNAGRSLGIYTAGDVQIAIWTLVDDNFDTSTAGEYSQARVDKIVSLSKQYGAGFYPSCKQEVVIIIDPGTPQTTLIEVRRDRFKKCAVPEEG